MLSSYLFIFFVLYFLTLVATDVNIVKYGDVFGVTTVHMTFGVTMES